jgi:hypothetical protein
MATPKQEAWLKANEPEAAVWEFYDYPDDHDQQAMVERLMETPETHVYRISEEPTTLVISDTPLTDDRIAQAVEANQRHAAGWSLVNGESLFEVWENHGLDPETLEDIAMELDIEVTAHFRDEVRIAQEVNAERNEAAETADLDALKVEMTTAEAQQKAAAATFYAVKEKYEFAKCIQSLPKDK